MTCLIHSCVNVGGAGLGTSFLLINSAIAGPKPRCERRRVSTTGRASRWSKEYIFAHETPQPASDPGQSLRRRNQQRKRIGHKIFHKVQLAMINIATYRSKKEILEMMEERRIDILGMAETRHWGKDKGVDNLIRNIL